MQVTLSYKDRVILDATEWPLIFKFPIAALIVLLVLVSATVAIVVGELKKLAIPLAIVIAAVLVYHFAANYW